MIKDMSIQQFLDQLAGKVATPGGGRGGGDLRGDRCRAGQHGGQFYHSQKGL